MTSMDMVVNGKMIVLGDVTRILNAIGTEMMEHGRCRWHHRDDNPVVGVFLLSVTSCGWIGSADFVLWMRWMAAWDCD